MPDEDQICFVMVELFYLKHICRQLKVYKIMACSQITPAHYANSYKLGLFKYYDAMPYI